MPTRGIMFTKHYEALILLENIPKSALVKGGCLSSATAEI